MIRLLTRPSLFRRLLIIEVLAAGCFWAAYTGLTLYSVYEQGAGFLDQDLRLLSQSMARTASTHTDPAGIQRVVEHIVALNYETSVPTIPQGDFAYQIWRADGTLLLRSSENPALAAIPPGSIATQERARRGEWIVHGAYSPDRALFAVAGYSDRALSRLRLRLIADASIGYLWVVAMLTAILWMATSIGLRPLRLLAAHLAVREQADLTPLRPAVAYDELTPLTTALNEKLDRLRMLLEKERTFFADAAHELRTPLAALEAQAHVLAVQSTSALRMQALQAFEAAVERMAAILNKLLLLARLDAAGTASVKRRADLVAILQRQAAQHAPRAIAAGSRVELEAPAAAELWCDCAAVETAVDHLIENAVTHTPPGTLIVVRLVTEADAYVISVSDDGPGIPEHERERVFDRFVRLDSARPGSGLGLAIVRNIARLHSGDARVRSGEHGRGCRVEIRLAAASDPNIGNQCADNASATQRP